MIDAIRGHGQSVMTPAVALEARSWPQVGADVGRLVITYSGINVPEPPISFGMSRCFGRSSRMRCTVSP